MSQKLQALLALANAAAETAEVDLSQVSKGGGGGKLYPAGYAFARFVRYIEFGMHPQEYQGKAKDPAMEFRMGFALFGDGYQNEDGTPGFISTYDMKLSNNEKASTKIIFDKMNWKNDPNIKHFAQMLGQAFLVKIEHKDIKDQPGKKRSVLNLKETLPPIDVVSKQPYPIPQVDDELLELFLWQHPTKEAWDALYIEGTNETTGKSKNFLQEKCLQALDFPGSPLEQLLRGSGNLPSPEQLAAMAPAAPYVAQTQATPSTPTAPAIPAASAPVAPVAPVPPQAPAVPPVPPVPQVPVAPAVPDVPFDGGVPVAPGAPRA